VDIPDWLRYLLLGAGAVVSLVCVGFVVRSIKRLNAGIQEFEKELEARQGAPLDPYSALAEIYSDQAKPKRRDRRR